MDRKLQAFERLLDIMDQLREGCPWDRKQTFESLRTLTIEETYELADSILKGDKQEIKKELGDILLHIVFYAKIGSETNDFDIADVCDGISEKLIYRHPHIFSDTKVADAKEVEENWEQLKLKEKNGNKSVLAGVPHSLPALVKANRIQDKVRGVGFDWDEKEQVWEKVKEEVNEVESEIRNGDQDKMEQEFGDLFFSLINAARLYGVNPENALERTNQKFMKRFNYLESKTLKQGRNLKEMNLEEMDEIWEEAKQFDK
ncbi:nucleoside triphosphate pyrophosphohydrolase [Marinifilum breve]|uniref:Nucleoside triphosphate pyrophosphohydrolase n=1 Tax=Marinifilum breve TaxID=2184082 RepID=A0A2V3ZUP5_9BACT|nr:nucleoside triphosphate pyrophosphohydrolase [Marinifilum breve]PXX98767.1 nucleoside triphosphate pyrophosphohydrolase [Marinifilum breve]